MPTNLNVTLPEEVITTNTPQGAHEGEKVAVSEKGKKNGGGASGGGGAFQ